MGRGRAKAKQTKVARRLKYDSGGTDLDALRAEIVGDPPSEANDSADGEQPAEDEHDEYADLYAKYLDEDDDERAGRRD